jgi:hypothetical protein
MIGYEEVLRRLREARSKQIVLSGELQAEKEALDKMRKEAVGTTKVPSTPQPQGR